MELRSQLARAFALFVAEPVAERFVAWGDTSGDNRLRYVCAKKKIERTK